MLPFSNQKRRTLMAALDCGTFCSKNVARSPNCGTFGKNHRNPYLGAFRTNSEANHKSVARFLIKSGTQILQIVAFFLTRTVASMYVSTNVGSLRHVCVLYILFCSLVYIHIIRIYIIESNNK